MTRRGLRLIGRYIRGQPRPFALAAAGATLFALAAVGTTVVLGRVTDNLVVPAFDGTGTTRAAFLGSMAALGCVTVLRAASIVLRRYFGAMTGRRTQAGLRREVTGRYLEVPMEYHHANPAGRLLAHADADIEAATEVIYPLPFSLGVVLLIFFSLVSLVLVDPLLTLVALVLFPTLALINRIYTSRIEEPAARVQEQVGRVASVAHESIDGAAVVKALGREADEVDRVRTEADGLRRARVEVGSLRAAFEPAIDALPNLGIVVLLAVGVWGISEGRISTGQLVQAMALFGILAFPMRVVGFFLQELPRSLVAIARVDGVLAAPPAHRHPDPRPLPAGPLGVEVIDVGFGFDADSRVLDGLSATLAPGEVVALVGATGSGKSTLVELLVGLIEPEVGEVRIGGIPVAHIEPADRYTAVSVAFQEAFLFAETVRTNITLGGPYDDAAVAEALRVAQADGFVAALPEGLDTVVGERGVTLSGGQRQRVALARALVRRPRLLLLDDATSAVDPTVEEAILAGLRSTLTTTSLIVAHRTSTIALADRVLFLDGGRIVADGSHEHLLATVAAYEAIVRAYESDEAGPGPSVPGGIGSGGAAAEGSVP